MSEFRIEKDSMGEVHVPAQAYYSAQTQRAVENFPISGQPLPARLIHALGLVKVAAAIANRDLGKLKLSWEVYNVTNTVRFDPQNMIDHQLIYTGLGVYSALLTKPRVMQFALRFDF